MLLSFCSSLDTHARGFFLCSFCAQREEVRRFLCVLSLGWNFLEMERDFLGLMSSSSKDVCIDHGKMNIIWFFLAIFGFRIIGCVWCLCVIWNVYSKRLISQSFRDDSTFSRKSQELLSFLSFPFFIYLFLWNCLFCWESSTSHIAQSNEFDISSYSCFRPITCKLKLLGWSWWDDDDMVSYIL